VVGEPGGAVGGVRPRGRDRNGERVGHLPCRVPTRVRAQRAPVAPGAGGQAPCAPTGSTERLASHQNINRWVHGSVVDDVIGDEEQAVAESLCPGQA
jgi:hypothetical protein